METFLSRQKSDACTLYQKGCVHVLDALCDQKWHKNESAFSSCRLAHGAQKLYSIQPA
jgi:hypothetical protein